MSRSEGPTSDHNHHHLSFSMPFFFFSLYPHVYSLFIGMLKHINWRQQLLHHVPPLGFPILIIKGTVLPFLFSPSVVQFWFLCSATNVKHVKKKEEFIIYFLTVPFSGFVLWNPKNWVSNPFLFWINYFAVSLASGNKHWHWLCCCCFCSCFYNYYVIKIEREKKKKTCCEINNQLVPFPTPCSLSKN